MIDTKKSAYTFQSVKILFVLILCILFLFSSCSQKPNKINLKWNKSYPTDTIEKNLIGLKWCLSFLGSTVAEDIDPLGIVLKGDTIQLDISKLGFSEKAMHHLQQLNKTLKDSEEYQTTNTVDLGRYIALTIGSSYHYYKITDTPDHLSDLKSRYVFDSIDGYINNSSVSLIHRIISYSKNNTGNQQAFISAEIDSITKEVFEFETVEVMSNGQLKFGIYDKEGKIKGAASSEITRAGKPAKCIWCHETVIQPLFSEQNSVKGYLPYESFKDSLINFNNRLNTFQEETWKEVQIRNKALHTDMELTYISFMEPSAEHISNEWEIPLKQVKEKLAHLSTHRHEEFDFLGNLYHREDIDVLAPWKTIKVPESIREKSLNEVDYLTYSVYLSTIKNRFLSLNSIAEDSKQSVSNN